MLLPPPLPLTTSRTCHLVTSTDCATPSFGSLALLIDGIMDGQDDTHILLPRMITFGLPHHTHTQTDRQPLMRHHHIKLYIHDPRHKYNSPSPPSSPSSPTRPHMTTPPPDIQQLSLMAWPSTGLPSPPPLLDALVLESACIVQPLATHLPSWRCSTAALKGRPIGPCPRVDAWGCNHSS